MERERTREPEAVPETYYEKSLQTRQKWIDRQMKGQLLIPSEEREYQDGRQGRVKYYLSPAMTDTALSNWSCFIHDIRRQSGRHRHQGGLLIYVIEGEGVTEVDGEVLNWQAGDLLLLPVSAGGVAHQHLNKDFSKGCRWMAFIYTPFRDYIADYIEQLIEKSDSNSDQPSADIQKLMREKRGSSDWKAKSHGEQTPMVTHPDELESVNLFNRLIQMRDQIRSRKRMATWLIRGEDLPWELNLHGKMQWYLHPSIAYSVLQTFLFYRQEISVGSRSGLQRHGGEVVFFILRGEGYTEVDGVRYNWRAEDVMTLPVRPQGVIYRHVNTGSEPVLLIGVEPNMVHTFGVDRHVDFEELQPCPESRH